MRRDHKPRARRAPPAPARPRGPAPADGEGRLRLVEHVEALAAEPVGGRARGTTGRATACAGEHRHRARDRARRSTSLSTKAGDVEEALRPGRAIPRLVRREHRLQGAAETPNRRQPPELIHPRQPIALDDRRLPVPLSPTSNVIGVSRWTFSIAATAGIAGTPRPTGPLLGACRGRDGLAPEPSGVTSARHARTVVRTSAFTGRDDARGTTTLPPRAACAGAAARRGRERPSPRAASELPRRIEEVLPAVGARRFIGAGGGKGRRRLRVSREQRRWIRLTFAGRDGMTGNRRELPRSKVAGHRPGGAA